MWFWRLAVAVAALAGFGAATAAVIRYDPAVVGREGTGVTGCPRFGTSAYGEPRGLFVMDDPRLTKLGPRPAGVAAPAGAEVYKALGAGENLTHGSDVQDGSHCANRAEWREPLPRSIQKFLVGTGNHAAAMRIPSRAAGNLGEWREWATPALGGSPSPAGCSTTYRQGRQWGDRFNLTVTVSGSDNWIVTVHASAPQWFPNSWNATVTRNNGNTVLVARPNGSGNAFGFTVMHGANWSWPRVSCRVA
jgi:hypothetical protein